MGIRFKILEKLGSKKNADKTGAEKKRPAAQPGWAAKQPLLPLFRIVRNAGAAGSVLLFAAAAGGLLFVTTLNNSLVGGSDATLPPKVREVKKEYTEIKDQYARFDFDMFRKITGKAPAPHDAEQDKLWGEATEIFFGLTYLEDFRESLKSLPDEGQDVANVKVAAPAVSVTGWIMPSPDLCVVTVSDAGKAGEWTFRRTRGAWATDDAPEGFFLDSMDVSPADGAPYFMLAHKLQPHLKWKVMLGDGYREAGPRDRAENGGAPVYTPYIKIAGGGYIYLQPPVTSTESYGTAAGGRNREAAGPRPDVSEIQKLNLEAPHASPRTEPEQGGFPAASPEAFPAQFPPTGPVE